MLYHILVAYIFINSLLFSKANHILKSEILMENMDICNVLKTNGFIRIAVLIAT